MPSKDSSKSKLAYSPNSMPKDNRNATILEWAAHTVLIVIVAYFIFYHFRGGPTVPSQRDIAIGDTLSVLEDYVAHEQSIVLALAPTCPYCLRSLPFYNKLIDHRNRSESTTSILAAVDTSEAIVNQQRILTQAGVDVDSIVAIPFGSIGIYGVPTLMHMDERFVLQGLWVGLLDKQREDSVLTELFVRNISVVPSVSGSNAIIE